MRKIRVLAIAPYSGLKTLMTETAAEWPDMDLQVHVADLEEGSQLVSNLQDRGYDVILSRGGTAEMIEKVAKIPVVEIRLSEYDILHAIRLAQSYKGKFAIVGFPNIIERINTISRLMLYDIDTVEIHSADEVPACLSRLKAEQYSLVIGDAVTVTTARQIQINGILITTGKESIASAFGEVRKIYGAMNMAHNHNLFYRDILNHSEIGVLVYGRSRQLLYTNFLEEEGQEDYLAVGKSILPHLDNILEQDRISLTRKSKGYLWHIRGVRGRHSQEECVFLYIKRSIDLSLLDKALSYQDFLQQTASQFYPFYDNSETIRPILQTAKKISETTLPVIIFGEQGTGKDTLALLMHQDSEMRDYSFLTINCRMLGEKQLSFLLGNQNSPLGETGMSIYFKNIHALSQTACHSLVSYLRDTSLHRRNRVIYSCETPPHQWDGSVLTAYLLHEDDSNCMTILLPSLRDRKGDIPSLASIYINELNMTLGKQIAGLDSGSVELLQSFPWLYNIDQFIKVLRELVLITSDTFIQAGDTQRVLQKESGFRGPSSGALPLEGTLDEITSKIIHAVLTEEGMNQTRAAKRLGISRSTMWRKLQA